MKRIKVVKHIIGIYVKFIKESGKAEEVKIIKLKLVFINGINYYGVK